MCTVGRGLFGIHGYGLPHAQVQTDLGVDDFGGLSVVGGGPWSLWVQGLRFSFIVAPGVFKIM